MLNIPIVDFLGKLEEAVEAICPEIPGLSGVTLEEEWKCFSNRGKTIKISTIDRAIVEIRFNYEAIARIMCDRLITRSSPFRSWGIKEIHICFGEFPPTEIHLT